MLYKYSTLPFTTVVELGSEALTTVTITQQLNQKAHRSVCSDCLLSHRAGDPLENNPTTLDWKIKFSEMCRLCTKMQYGLETMARACSWANCTILLLPVPFFVTLLPSAELDQWSGHWLLWKQINRSYEANTNLSLGYLKLVLPYVHYQYRFTCK